MENITVEGVLPPEVVDDILAPVVAAASDEPLVSAILVGSLARGEFTMRSSLSRLDLWSDVDLYFVAPPSAQVNQVALRAKYEQLTDLLHMPNPFFHIDFSLLHTHRLHALAKQISTFEARENGIILLGRDLRNELPKVTIDTLDFGNTRHLVLVRLAEMFFNIPARIVHKTANEYEQLIFGYVQARNALDIATILLPHEGVLLSSYRARNRYLLEHYPELDASRYMGPYFVTFMDKALEAKLSLQMGDKSTQFYEQTQEGYYNLLRYLLQAKDVSTIDELLQSLHRSTIVFNNQHQPLRQRLHDMKLVARSKLLNRPGLHPSHSTKHLISFLMWAHAALLAHMRGSDDAGQALQNARESLSALAPQVPLRTVDEFAQDWLCLRHSFLDTFTSLFVAKRLRRSHYESLLNCTYDDFA